MSAVDKGEARFGGKSKLYCVKLGNTNSTWNEIWSNYGKAPRRTHPPHSLASREMNKRTNIEIVHVIRIIHNFLTELFCA